MVCLAANNEQHKEETEDEETKIERKEPQPPKRFPKEPRIASEVQSSPEVNKDQIANLKEPKCSGRNVKHKGENKQRKSGKKRTRKGGKNVRLCEWSVGGLLTCSLSPEEKAQR